MEPTPPSSNGLLLATENLVKEYHSRRVVNGVSITVGAGEIVGLLGPNGAGKTTTFNMVVGLVKPDGGAVKFQGRGITNLPMHRRARLGIGYLTQEPSVFRKLTVEENILAILETCKLSRDERAVRLEVFARGTGFDAAGQEQGVHAQRRRKTAAGNHPRAGDQPETAAAGRAVQRH
jgi:ABC-type lipopolysaccharide export system ATPase subunit